MGNSIEEALEKLSNGKKIKMYELLRTFKREGIENFVITRKKYVDVILSDYKRVLKENEELKQEKINNYRILALAQNEALGYMQGYEDGKKLKRSAVASIVENQQYYIIQKQMEKYEEHIKRLQKENEELRAKWDKDTHILQNELDLTNADKINNYIPIQKLKDKIEDLKMSGGSDGKDNTENTARELAIEALQNILEESEE